MSTKWILGAIASAVALGPGAAGCSGDSGAAAPAASGIDAGVDAPHIDAASDAVSEDAAMPVVCDKGAAVGADGACHPFGIQGCAADFVGPDGMCHPSLSKCPPGKIPQLGTGCVPVGIPGCAAVFMEADGLCHPTAAKCPPATIPVPSEGCVSLDPPNGCGAAPWGDVADAPGTLYVDPSAAAGGDGSKGKPFTTITAAILKVGTKGRIVLAAGTYPEPVLYQSTFEVIGRCASMVRITGKQAVTGGSATVVMGAPSTALSNVTVSGSAVGLLTGSGSIALDHVHFGKTLGLALYIVSASATMTHVLVDGTIDTPTHPLYGGAIRIFGGKSTITKSAFVDNTGATITVAAGGTLALTDSLLEGTKLWSDGVAVGLEVDANASATASGIALVRHAGRGAQADGVAAKLDLATSIIEGTTMGDNSEALAFLVAKGAAATLTDSALVGNLDMGALATGTGASGTVTRTLVRDTVRQDGIVAYGITAQTSASLTVVDTTISATIGYGLVAGGMGTITASGVLVEGSTSPTPDKVVAGVIAVVGANVTATGSAFVGNSAMGAVADRAGVLSLQGCLIEGSVPTPLGYFGVGLWVEDAVTSITGSLIVGNTVAGVLSSAQAALTVDATRIAGTKLGAVLFDDDPAPIPGLGDGLVAVGEGNATVTNTLVTQCARSGFIFDSGGGSIASSSSHGNDYGIVLQNMPQPTLGAGNDFSSNTKASSLSDGNLAVPNGSVPTPTPM